MSFGVVKDDKYVGAAGPAVPGTQYVGTKITPLVSTGEELWHTVNGDFSAFEDNSTVFTVPEDGLYLLGCSVYIAWWHDTTSGGGTNVHWWLNEAGDGVCLSETYFGWADKLAQCYAVVPLKKGQHLTGIFRITGAGHVDEEVTYRPYFYVAKIEEELV